MPPEASQTPGNLPTPADRKRLEHILQSARDARTIVAASDATSLAQDMIRSRALVNCFTEIGEAAARLTQHA